MMTRKMLGSLCLLVLCGILVVGLWPFHAPKNEVRWLSPGPGLLFGKYGSIVSAAAFDPKSQRADNSCSLEIWLEPTRVQSSGTILAFYHANSRVTPFSLRQSLGDLVIQRTPQEEGKRAGLLKAYIEGVFTPQRPVLVTIRAGKSGMTVYADGVFVKRVSSLGLSSQDLTGQLIVGTSPVTADGWSGRLKGLAIYNRELTEEDVSENFANWGNRARPDLAKRAGAVALYIFNEGIGNVVHNQLDSTTDLLIPDQFFILQEQFLERPWDEFRPDLNYWKDVGINVAGFIPLGFFFYAYLSLVRSSGRAAAIAIALGFTVSLTIELLQSFLPTRNSGMTDLITNTMGTAIGVMVFRLPAVQAVMAATGLIAAQTIQATSAFSALDS